MAINNVNGLNRISYFDYSKIGAKKEDTTSKSTTKSTDTYSISAEAKASMTKETQSKDVKVESTDGEFVNDTKFPDELVKYIRECAVKGAKDGHYASSTNVSQTIVKYAQKTVGPDRESLKMQMAPYINPPKGNIFSRMVSLMNGFSANLNYGHLDEALFVYNPSGEKVLTYSHNHGGWDYSTTKAENAMETELFAIYAEAFDEERSYMHENGIKDKTGKVPTDPYDMTPDANYAGY